MNQYVAGTLVAVKVEFSLASSGAAVDPNTVVLRTSVEGDQPNTYTYGVDMTITRISTGVYVANLDTTEQAGTWTYQWQGSGTSGPQAIDWSQFLVTSAPL